MRCLAALPRLASLELGCTAAPGRGPTAAAHAGQQQGQGQEQVQGQVQQGQEQMQQGQGEQGQPGQHGQGQEEQGPAQGEQGQQEQMEQRQQGPAWRHPYTHARLEGLGAAAPRLAVLRLAAALGEVGLRQLLRVELPGIHNVGWVWAKCMLGCGLGCGVGLGVQVCDGAPGQGELPGIRNVGRVWGVCVWIKVWVACGLGRVFRGVRCVHTQCHRGHHSPPRPDMPTAAFPRSLQALAHVSLLTLRYVPCLPPRLQLQELSLELLPVHGSGLQLMPPPANAGPLAAHPAAPLPPANAPAPPQQQHHNHRYELASILPAVCVAAPRLTSLTVMGHTAVSDRCDTCRLRHVLAVTCLMLPPLAHLSLRYI